MTNQRIVNQYYIVAPLSPASAIPPAALFMPFALQRRMSVLLSGVQVDHAPARLADPAPFPYQGPLPEEIPLHAQAVIAVHAARRMMPFEVEGAGWRVPIGN